MPCQRRQHAPQVQVRAGPFAGAGDPTTSRPNSGARVDEVDVAIGDGIEGPQLDRDAVAALLIRRHAWRGLAQCNPAVKA